MSQPLHRPEEEDRHVIGTFVADFTVAGKDGPLGAPERLAQQVRMELLPALEEAVAEGRLGAVDAVVDRLEVDLGQWPAAPDWPAVRAEFRTRFLAALAPYLRPRGAAQDGSKDASNGRPRLVAPDRSRREAANDQVALAEDPIADPDGDRTREPVSALAREAPEASAVSRLVDVLSRSDGGSAFEVLSTARDADPVAFDALLRSMPDQASRNLLDRTTRGTLSSAERLGSARIEKALAAVFAMAGHSTEAARTFAARMTARLLIQSAGSTVLNKMTERAARASAPNEADQSRPGAASDGMASSQSSTSVQAGAVDQGRRAAPAGRAADAYDDVHALRAAWAADRALVERALHGMKLSELQAFADALLPKAASGLRDRIAGLGRAAKSPQAALVAVLAALLDKRPVDFAEIERLSERAQISAAGQDVSRSGRTPLGDMPAFEVPEDSWRRVLALLRGEASQQQRPGTAENAPDPATGIGPRDVSTGGGPTQDRAVAPGGAQRDADAAAKRDATGVSGRSLESSDRFDPAPGPDPTDAPRSRTPDADDAAGLPDTELDEPVRDDAQTDRSALTSDKVTSPEPGADPVSGEQARVGPPEGTPRPQAPEKSATDDAVSSRARSGLSGVSETEPGGTDPRAATSPDEALWGATAGKRQGDRASDLGDTMAPDPRSPVVGDPQEPPESVDTFEDGPSGDGMSSAAEMASSEPEASPPQKTQRDAPLSDQDDLVEVLAEAAFGASASAFRSLLDLIWAMAPDNVRLDVRSRMPPRADVSARETEEERAPDRLLLELIARAGPGVSETGMILRHLLDLLAPEVAEQRGLLRQLIARLGYAGPVQTAGMGPRVSAELGQIYEELEAPTSPPTAPASVRDMPEPDTARRLLTRTAGLVLFHPFLKLLFSRLDLLTPEGRMHGERLALGRAALEALAGAPASQQSLDPLARLLLGMTDEMPPPPFAELDEAQAALVDGLLRSVIAQWAKLGQTSPAGLQDAFVRRGGQMRFDQAGAHLRVDPGPFDMLLDSLPWALDGTVALSWMATPCHVTWRAQDG